jgi:NADH-quinone oxidoreductase subunit L
MDFSFTLLVLVLPLTTFGVLGLMGNRFKPMMAGLIGTTNLFIITILSYYTAYLYFTGTYPDGYPSLKAFNSLWLTFTDHLQIHLGILLDPLSVMMLVVITTVSLMVHIYSLGYMKGEKGFQLFFLCLLFPCWGWWLPRTFFRCISFGNWLAYHHTY